MNAHPDTGEVLETEADFMEAIQSVERRMWPLFIQRNELQAEYARCFPHAQLPAPRNQTDKQQKVARCPRCRGELE